MEEEGDEGDGGGRGRRERSDDFRVGRGREEGGDLVERIEDEAAAEGGGGQQGRRGGEGWDRKKGDEGKDRVDSVWRHRQHGMGNSQAGEDGGVEKEWRDGWR